MKRSFRSSIRRLAHESKRISVVWIAAASLPFVTCARPEETAPQGDAAPADASLDSAATSDASLDSAATSDGRLDSTVASDGRLDSADADGIGARGDADVRAADASRDESATVDVTDAMGGAAGQRPDTFRDPLNGATCRLSDEPGVSSCRLCQGVPCEAGQSCSSTWHASGPCSDVCRCEGGTMECYMTSCGGICQGRPLDGSFGCGGQGGFGGTGGSGGGGGGTGGADGSSDAADSSADAEDSSADTSSPGSDVTSDISDDGNDGAAVTPSRP